MSSADNNNESELESFRKRWQEEVSKKRTIKRPENRRLSAGDLTRTLGSTSQTAARPGSRGPESRPSAAVPSSSQAAHESREEQEPYFFHDLDDKEEYYKLDNAHLRSKATPKEPTTALDHYEKAVEKETVGSLGDSVSLYRKAFKLDDQVHEAYKQKHFPPSSFPPKSKNAGTGASSNKNSTNIKERRNSNNEAVPQSLSELITSFSAFSITPKPPETDLSPQKPCPVSTLPEELLASILLSLALTDVASFARAAQVCKRFAYLVATEDMIWKRVALGSTYGTGGMKFRYLTDLHWESLAHKYNVLSNAMPVPRPIPDLTPSVYPTYRSQFRHRPRIRFNGCYISVVNYQRPGASMQNAYNWVSPIHIVTYYRYLRFYRDGTVISLLSTAEPSDVVHHITKDNMKRQQSEALPSAVMNKGLRGRWRLSGSASSVIGKPVDGMPTDADKGPGEYAREPQERTAIAKENDHEGHPAGDVDAEEEEEEEIEEEGDLLIETQGVTPNYIWKMQFGIGHAGKKEGPRNNKLYWKGFWSYNKQMVEWSPFGLKKDKPYYFSRVKSYGVGE